MSVESIFHRITWSNIIECFPAFLLSLFFMLMIAIYVSKKMNLFGDHYEKDSSSLLYETCKSLDCFRCSRSADILNLAYHRFLEYSKRRQIQVDLHEKTGLERIRMSFTKALLDNEKSVADKEKKGMPENEQLPEEDDTIQKPMSFILIDMYSNNFWNNVYQADLEKLKMNFTVIKEEFEAAVSSTNGYWTTNSTPSGNWDLFSFVNQGHILPQNTLLCPKTWALIQSMDCFMADCVLGNALFSVVHPGTVITKHIGLTNARLRCHFALTSPKGCYLTVNGQCATWKEGECLLFDDSFPHSVDYTVSAKGDKSADNPAEDRAVFTEDCRVVLILDLWHPSLTEIEKDALSYVFSSIGTCVLVL